MKTMPFSLFTSSGRTETVSFDVGGKIHRVSKSLIEQHENSLLARMVSDTWNKSSSLADDDDCGRGAGENDPIFIEANGERFQYILDFMRYGKLILPFHVSKEMVLKDLEFFCLDGVNEETVRYGHVYGQIRVDELKKLKESLTEGLETVNQELLVMKLASICFGRYISKTGYLEGEINVPTTGAFDATDQPNINAFLNQLHYRSPAEVALFNKCLEIYGLTFCHSRTSHNLVLRPNGDETDFGKWKYDAE